MINFPNNITVLKAIKILEEACSNGCPESILYKNIIYSWCIGECHMCGAERILELLKKIVKK